MKLIDKDRAVAEMEKRKDETTFLNEFANGTKFGLETAIDVVNSLEVIEVDFENEFTNYAKDILACDIQFEPYTHLKKCAKHFFGLGLSSQLSWQDIKRLAEIGDTFINSEESDNLFEEEYYTEILNKFKAQKGEEV